MVIACRFCSGPGQSNRIVRPYRGRRRLPPQIRAQTRMPPPGSSTIDRALLRAIEVDASRGRGRRRRRVRGGPRRCRVLLKPRRRAVISKASTAVAAGDGGSPGLGRVSCSCSSPRQSARSTSDASSSPGLCRTARSTLSTASTTSSCSHTWTTIQPAARSAASVSRSRSTFLRSFGTQ